jgi:hypothetical protein
MIFIKKIFDFACCPTINSTPTTSTHLPTVLEVFRSEIIIGMTEKKIITLSGALFALIKK